MNENDKNQILNEAKDITNQQIDKTVKSAYKIVAGIIVILSFFFAIFGISTFKGAITSYLETDSGKELIKNTIKTTVINHPSLPIKPNLPEGSIMPSVLEPEKMNRMTKGNWILAEGLDSDLTTLGSNYSIKTINGLPRLFIGDNMKFVVPDLRGVFLRGMNNNNQGKDPSPNRLAGDTQADQLRDHMHDIDPDTITASGKVENVHAHNTVLENKTKVLGLRKNGEVRDGKRETRPVNVSVYYYIKIK